LCVCISLYFLTTGEKNAKKSFFENAWEIKKNQKMKKDQQKANK